LSSAIFKASCRFSHGGRGVDEIYRLLNSGSDIQSIGFWRRKKAKRFVEDFLPTIDHTTGHTSCRAERQESGWIHELLSYSESELIAWYASVRDNSAWKRAKSERRLGRSWCTYDDFVELGAVFGESFYK
jgi:hypothetical protein